MDEELFESLKAIAEQYIQEEKYKEALTYYETLIESDKTKEDLYSKKALCEKNLNQYSKAIQDYRNAMKINPKNIDNLKNLTELLIITGSFSYAVDIMSPLMWMDSKDEKISNQMLLIQETQEEVLEMQKRFKENNYLETEKLCKKILLKSPEYIEVQLMLVRVLLRNNKIDETIYFINNKIGEENRKLKHFDYYIARAYYLKYEFDEALNILKKLINEIKDNDEKYQFLKNNAKKLIENIERIILLKVQADELYDKENYEEAIEIYNQILKADESNKILNSVINSKISLCNQKINNSIFETLTTIHTNFKNLKIGNKNKYNLKEECKNNNEIKNDLIKDNNDIQPELYKFIKSFPCVLKLGAKNNIESYNSCLNSIPKDRIEFQEENKLSSMENNHKDNFAMVDDTNVSAGLSLYYNDLNFNLKKANSRIYEKNSNSFIVKRKLYSITIKEEDISFRPLFLNKFENIAKSPYSDEIKADQLDDLFKDIGFFIPLKAYIGGSYNLGNLNEKKRIELKKNIDAKYNGQIKFNKNFGIKKRDEFEKEKDLIKNSEVFIGGEKCNNYEDWFSSINLKNSDIIEYTEFRKIYDFLSDDLARKLEKPIELIKQKYKMRENYFELLKELENNRGENYFNERSDTLKIGICEFKYPNIYCYDTISFYEKPLFFGKSNKTINQTFEDIIIGIEIKNYLYDGDNGNFSFYNPILQKELNIDFISKFRKQMGYLINIYLIKPPK